MSARTHSHPAGRGGAHCPGWAEPDPIETRLLFALAALFPEPEGGFPQTVLVLIDLFGARGCFGLPLDSPPPRVPPAPYKGLSAAPPALSWLQLCSPELFPPQTRPHQGGQAEELCPVPAFAPMLDAPEARAGPGMQPGGCNFGLFAVTSSGRRRVHASVWGWGHPKDNQCQLGHRHFQSGCGERGMWAQPP